MAIFDLLLPPWAWLSAGLALGCLVGAVVQRQIGRGQRSTETEELQREIDQWAYRTLGHEAAAEKARAELHANVAATVELKRKLTVLEQQHSVLTASLERNRALLDYTVKAYTELRQRDPADAGNEPPAADVDVGTYDLTTGEQRAQA